MDSREANLPADNNHDPNLYRSFNATTSSSSSSFTSSPPDFLRNVQAAFKRHRMMPQLNNLQPRRLVVPRQETSKSLIDSKKTDESHDVSVKQRVQDSSAQTKNMMTVTTVNHEYASITPPLISGTPTEEGKFKSIGAQRGQPSFSCDCRSSNMVDFPCLKCGHVQLVDGPKKVHFALGNDARSHEMECDVGNQLDASTAPSNDANNQNFHDLEVDLSSRSNDEISSLLAKGTTGVQNQINPLRNFVHSEFGHHVTQSSLVGSASATTTLVNSASAPKLTSTTHSSRPYQHSNFHAGNSYDNYQGVAHIDTGNPPKSLPKYSSKVLADKTPFAAVDSYPENKCEIPRDHQGKEAGSCGMPKDPPPLTDKSTKADLFAGDVIDLQSHPPVSNDAVSNVKSVPSKPGKVEKPASKKDASAARKRNYDPDLFFKVNGKLYQRLGKIGSGGSSEVHKVISQDCTIYALKKIKLKGRDYATAYGFCQEIEYLNKLKGKDHIIQLIDYEVTDKVLLKEVMSGSMTNKDGRVKEDGCIYMVLEYGEIDLAHMLSQKWRELDSSKSTIDENWLRFYWQQILLAVKTIHEERIVHSDLKPANFLLVRGSLKLIDFGIAKAILSDTTNIQRDSQVGTLSYMSPEAFMCNETDANGNTIKCGRPSDIWSLGCILYQMVYGRTPFADYTTFWAKFKVITDPNYEIPYEPLSNLWLLDLIKKCLSWDRKERWTIPQLLQHPFLVPPIPPRVSDNHRNLIHLVADSCSKDSKARMLCSQLQQLVADPLPDMKSGSLITIEERCRLLNEVSKLCLQIKEQLEM
ncbi:hypothetical protein L6452_39188 [Arctium lappa]|uniref:Uncharacterized protein n=1 Tax=Arctium lappa TaxID=4217 RepID=A0ACB8XRL7_ARCLA|nr:hypothetical protein L6452_39188 [Arctium lappa]